MLPMLYAIPWVWGKFQVWRAKRIHFKTSSRIKSRGLDPFCMLLPLIDRSNYLENWKPQSLSFHHWRFIITDIEPTPTISAHCAPSATIACAHSQCRSIPLHPQPKRVFTTCYHHLAILSHMRFKCYFLWPCTILHLPYLTLCQLHHLFLF